MQLHTAGLIVIKERRLLLAFSNNKMAFYLPGGKIDESEDTTEGLCREIKEEMNIEIHKDDLKFFMHVTAPAYGEINGVIMEQDCYLYALKETPTAAAEIGVLEYFDKATYLKQPAQVPGVLIVMDKLQQDGMMN